MKRSRSPVQWCVVVGSALSAACHPISVPRDTGLVSADAAQSPDAWSALDARADSAVAADAARDSGPRLDGASDGQAIDVASADSAAPDAALPDAARPDTAVPDTARPDATPHVCPTSGALDCSPGSGTGEGDQCGDAPSCYYNQVRAAVNGTISGNSGWFEHSETYSCEIVLDVESYMNAVVSALVGGGLCAIRDPNAPGEEITVKHDNAFSENFDILASNGCARSGAATYTGFCAPAWW